MWAQKSEKQLTSIDFCFIVYERAATYCSHILHRINQMSGASLVDLAAAVYLCERSCDGGLLLWQLYNVSARPTPSKPVAPHPTTPVQKSWLRRSLSWLGC